MKNKYLAYKTRVKSEKLRISETFDTRAADKGCNFTSPNYEGH